MAYDDDESSVAAGAPVEGYEFIGAITTWRYTSGIEDVDIDGDTYTPLAGLVRGSLSIGTTKDTPTMSMRLPASTPLVGQYAFGAPPRSLRLKVYRKQTVSGEWKVVWDGEVSSIVVRGPMADVTCPSLLGKRMSTNVPGLTVRTHCNHWLFDERCRVSRAAFTHTSTVASVSADGRTVTVSGGGWGDNTLRGGEIVRDSDGERRTIILQTVSVLLIAAPFRTLANPDPVTLYEGCDHLVETCDTKFGNLDNFGGFPTMPAANPYKNPLRLGGV